MTDTIPDRLSIDPDSPHYDQELLLKGVRVKFRGEEKTNVEEFCISEGWIKVQAGKTVDRKGKPLLLTLRGEVEAWIEAGASD